MNREELIVGEEVLVSGAEVLLNVETLKDEELVPVSEGVVVDGTADESVEIDEDKRPEDMLAEIVETVMKDSEGDENELDIAVPLVDVDKPDSVVDSPDELGVDVLDTTVIDLEGDVGSVKVDVAAVDALGPVDETAEPVVSNDEAVVVPIWLVLVGGPGVTILSVLTPVNVLV